MFWCGIQRGIIHLVRTQNFPKNYYFLPPDTQTFIVRCSFLCMSCVILGFFQALCHNTIFVFQIEFVKGRRREKSTEGLGALYAQGSSAYLNSENLLYQLKFSHLLLTLA